MTVFADIHIHMLYHTDDGPRTREQMLAMLEQACAAGTRLFCVTPHFHYGLFGDNAAQAQAAFAELREAAARLCPEAAVVLGNELRWGPSAVEWLDRGAAIPSTGPESSRSRWRHPLRSSQSGSWVPFVGSARKRSPPP